MPLVFDTEKKESQQFLSDEMTEFITNKPHWVVRRGSLFLLLILVALICLSSLIEYPDIIVAKMRIVAVNNPKLLIAQKEGKLEKLLVSNDQQVTEGQLLAFIQSTADHKQILDLYSWIESIEPYIQDSLDILLYQPPPPSNKLGETQAAYQDFETKLRETQQILATGFYQKKKAALERDIQNMQEAQSNILRQREITNKDMELQQAEFKVKETLASEHVIAPLELNQDKSKLLIKQQNVEQINAQVISNKLATDAKQKEIADLQKFISDQKQTFHSALFNLKSRLQEWISQYVVIATTSGKINFISFLQENQFIQNNQELFYIIPSSNKFYGELKANQSGVGKIKKGQKVIVKLNSFPSQEFGHITGSIDYISTVVESDGTMLIKVEFLNGLRTNYNKNLIFKSNMDATAEIITDNRILPERLMGNLRKALTR